MRKSNTFITIGLICIIFVSFCLFIADSNKNGYDIYIALVEAIFTGSVIALPGYIILLCSEVKKSKDDLHDVYYNSLRIIEDCIPFLHNADFNNSTVRDSRVHLVESYYRINKLSTENFYPRKKTKMHIIADEIFNYSTFLIELSSLQPGTLEFSSKSYEIVNCAAEIQFNLKQEISKF